MGFDNECILNIQSLAGEYFCPVCRLLVLPNETLQAQCTHLYCKPCIAYTANSTRACPYDGYLVTESDAKPLAESNKALADIINKIAVHCLYHRSGCTWQGSLEECVTHCSGCAFGNSPVVCNRCALQIVHRQVQEHAQTCPGVQPQATAQTQEATSANAAAAAQSQTANPISGVSVSSQAAAQTATAVTPTQDPKQQPDPSTQGQAVPVGTEQWYQQQYHQYYQQFGGYEAYQQQYQQFYQQQAASQAQLYPQTQVQPQQPQLQTQAPLQSNPQAPPQPLTSSQSQNQSQPQPQMQQHGQPILSIQPQDLPSQVQTVMGSQPLNQQQQVQSVVPANQQLQMQNHLAQQYPQAQLQVQQYPSQSYPQQHGQVPVYQQPQVLQLQPQGHPQQQLPPQGHLQQLPPHVHPQQQLLPHPQAPQVQSSQQLQSAQQQIPALNPLPQSKIPTQGVTAYQSYPPLQSHLPRQSGGSQQQNLHVRPPQTTQTIQGQGHLPQQSSQIHPPQFQQQQAVLLPPSLPNIPPAQQPNYHPNQQVGQVVPQRGVMQSVQQHMAPQIGHHQQPPLGGQHVGATHSQFNHRGASSQLPMRPQSQISPQGLPHTYQSHQNVLGPNNMKHSHAYQNLSGRHLLQAYGVADHIGLNAPVGPQVRPMQPGYKQKNMAGSSKAPRGKIVTAQHASLPETSAEMEKKSLTTDSGQKRAGRSDSDGKNPIGDLKSVSEDDKPGQTEPAGIVEEDRAINGLQASESGEASVNQTAKVVSAQRNGEQLDGKVSEISADKKDDPTSDPKVEEKAAVEDKANVEGHPQATPVRQNDLEGQSQIGGGLEAHPSNSERNAVKDHMQRQASGFSHEGGPLQQKSVAPSLLDPSPPGPPLHQPNAPGQILNQVHGQLKQSHPPHSRMLLREHLVTGVPPDVFEAPNQRPFHFDGRQSGPNFSGATGLNGQPSDFHSNFSLRDERMIYVRDEHMKYSLADPSRRVYDRVFDDELRNSSEHITKFESYLSSGRPFGRGPFDKAVLGPSPNPGDPAASASLRIFPHDRERGPFGPPEHNLGKLDPSRMHPDGFSSGYSRHHLDKFLPRSPGREYDGFRSRFLDLHNRYAPDIVRRDLYGPDGPIGSSLHESRFPSLPGPFRKSEFDENFRGEHMRSGDLMGRDLFPSHIHRGELSGPGRLSNHWRMGEPGGLSSFHDRPRPGESVVPEIYGARIGEPGHKSTFPLPPYLDDAIYKGGIETFDDGLRKRRTISMGWCRLCKVDCETVEGLDVHSQSREHQEMAMDMVRSIKQQNAKKQKQSSSSKSSAGNDAHGNKH